jgi:hypothetical protein
VKMFVIERRFQMTKAGRICKLNQTICFGECKMSANSSDDVFESKRIRPKQVEIGVNKEHLQRSGKGELGNVRDKPRPRGERQKV